jgi:hypothetical protein
MNDPHFEDEPSAMPIGWLLLGLLLAGVVVWLRC